ncbi:MAG: type II toxin-antitoxin system RelE/ParE family toxin [Rhodoplanes sp.]|uniref:type II toxin-antitoxin system RelE/ParE family toxin n=1 Tax=Rhodoplanes sp. TaxID=1968906 RepID=UPI001835D36E|nr:type II toxin-antitoxin system RelE/ParE family toxin [Rhodoplanes sp.]NVO12967.1 type II toxin-antitoxin system RelE/ParE family toxin [Rhodoplanes sp.]
MRKLAVRYRPEAVADLEDVLRYIARASASASIAEQYVRRIMDRCNRIGETPRAGRSRDDLRPGLRTVAFERTVVIAYMVEADAVRIVNVFYGGRDFEALYRGADSATETESGD